MSIMTYVNKYLHAKREGFKVEQKLAKIYFFPKLLRITCTRSTFFSFFEPFPKFASHQRNPTRL